MKRNFFLRITKFGKQYWHSYGFDYNMNNHFIIIETCKVLKADKKTDLEKKKNHSLTKYNIKWKTATVQLTSRNFQIILRIQEFQENVQMWKKR